MVPLIQQDYFKYYQLLKGNFYKSAAALRALLNDPVNGAELLNAATAVAVLFAGCANSEPERLALKEVDRKKKADVALNTYANLISGQNFASLQNALGDSNVLTKLLADEDSQYAIFNLKELFNQIVTIAQTTPVVAANTAKYEQFYMAYCAVSWNLILTNCTQAGFTAPSVITGATNDAEYYYSLFSTQRAAGTYVALSGGNNYLQIISQAGTVLASSGRSYDKVYISEKYAVMPLAYTATGLVYTGFMLCDIQSGKTYAYMTQLTNDGSSSFSITSQWIGFDEVNKTVMMATQFNNNTSSVKYGYVWKAEINFDNESVTSAQGTSITSGNVSYYYDIYGIRVVPLGYCTIAVIPYSSSRYDYNMQRRNVQIYYTYRGWGAVSSVGSGHAGFAHGLMWPYNSPIFGPRYNPVYKYACKVSIGFAGLCPYAEQSTETNTNQLANVPRIVVTGASVNTLTSSGPSSRQFTYSVPATLQAYFKYLGIFDAHATSPIVYYSNNQPYAGDCYQLEGEHFDLFVFQSNDFYYTNTANSKVSKSLYFAVLYTMDANGTFGHHLFRLTNMTTSIKWEPHMNTLSITGIRMNNGAGVDSTDALLNSSYTYVLRKPANGNTTLTKEAAPAESIALPSYIPAHMGLICPDTICSQYNSPSIMLRTKMF